MKIRRKFMYKVLSLFLIIVLFYTAAVSSIILYKSHQLSDTQYKNSQQLFIQQNSIYADFILKTALSFVYKTATLQSVIDYRYSNDTNPILVTGVYNDLRDQLEGFGQIGFNINVTKLTDNIVITPGGTFRTGEYLKEMGIHKEALDYFKQLDGESDEKPFQASKTYVVPQTMMDSSNKIVIIHKAINSVLPPLYFFIVVDRRSLLPEAADTSEGSLYLYTDDIVTAFIQKERLDPEIRSKINAVENDKNIHDINAGSTVNYIYYSEIIPNLKFVYVVKAFSFNAIMKEIWKTVFLPSLLLLLLGALLAYFAARSSYKPIGQLLHYLQSQRDNEPTEHTYDDTKTHEIAFIRSRIEQIYMVNHTLQHRLNDSYVHLKEDLFRKALYGIASEEVVRHNLSILGMERFQDELTLMLIEGESMGTLETSMSHFNLTLYIAAIIQTFEEHYEDFFILPLDKTKLCVIFHSSSSDALMSVAHGIINKIQNDLSLELSASISQTYRLEELTLALHELLHLSSYHYVASDKVLTSENVKDLEELILHYPIELETNLIHYVNTNEMDKANELLLHLLQDRANRSLSPSEFTNLKHSILNTFKRCLNSNGKTLNQFAIEYANMVDEFMAVSASKFKEKTLTLFEMIFIFSTKDRFSLESSMASQIFIYIHQHFDKDLSLSEIAEHFNLSDSYVSKLLKNALDINFKQYVNTLKVNRAKELFKQGNYKVQEVASLVGCNNTNTFIRIFKQFAGVSPGEYLKSLN